MPQEVKLWKFESPDGSEAMYGPYGPDAYPEDWVGVEVPRMPEDHEKWENGQWVLDSATKTRETEEAQLRGMSEIDKQNKAVEKARMRIIDDMELTGVVNPVQAQKLRESRGKNKENKNV